MAQFTVYRNKNPATRGRYPLLLDVQSDLLEPLNTRVVVPLAAAGSGKTRQLAHLTPVLSVEGRDYLMITPQLAGIPSKELGAVVTSIADQRDRILGAMDFLLTGI